MIDISKDLLLKHTGQLHDTGDTVNMLGMMLQRRSDGIMIYESAEYYTPIVQDNGLHKANSVNAPGTSTPRPDDSVELLSSDGHSKYRRTVGKLQWQSPIRPDISYATKELARHLTAPTTRNETI